GGPTPRIVAIGASTGGPAALATILAAMPKNPPFAIVAVHHLDAGFVPGLVSWLSRETGRRVEIAAHGNPLQAGVCSIAGSDAHLLVDPRGRLVQRAEPADAIHRPSVDVLFRSLVSSRIEPCAAALLTGMGRDGAEGLLELRNAGWHTIAQDRSTSVVWGMPGAADRLGAAAAVLPLPLIAGEILRIAESPRRSNT
ncbi:MAG: chemotaxis response regulator protein-glutamate methylesterase, partial [Phycisphaerae bacterium]|nr:chemotaxis response regulator protein-glutamate methylesterase [Phycisphaerae bacterium]